MKKLFFLAFALSLIIISAFKFSPDSNPPLWMRYPSISPDGKTIVFTYKGDLFKVNASGGTAVPITTSDGYDFMPVWSPDGKWIAFASDRYGNYDVFVMPAEGGSAKRLTFYASHDLPYCFTSDGSSVMYSSPRMDNFKSAQFPSGVLPELYSVAVTGGREKQVLSVAAEEVKWNKAGDKMLFHDKKGYEDIWRKHHTSSVTRDIWIWAKKENKFTKLSNFNGEDRNPVWGPDETEVYSLEKSGSFNIWKMRIDDPSNPTVFERGITQITKFDKDPVRFLSIATNGTLCFGFNGEIYTKTPSGSEQKVNIKIEEDDRYTETKTESFTTGASYLDVSPNGKEVVFSVRGEIFVSSIEGGITKRITNTPEQERSVSFSPDGRSILYAGERNKIWGLYQTSLTRKEETHFFNSTVLKEEPILVGTTEAFQPRYSPDGNEVAYLEERTAVKIINLKTKAIRTILPADKNYSYADGDQWFDWSPDGKYMLVNYLQQGNWLTQIGLIETTGSGTLVNLSKSGFDNGGAKWMMNGKSMIWFSNRNGMRNWSAQATESDVYGLFFTQDGYDRFKMNKEEFGLLKEKEEKAKSKTDTTKKITTPVKIELGGIDDRHARMTMHSSDLSDAILSNDGEQLYYLCKFEKGYDLWVNKFREHETKMLQRLDAGWAGDMHMDKEGKNIFVIADGNIVKINIEKPEKKDVTFNAEMNLNTSAERAYLFEHAWRQVVKKFYVTDLQKTDWNYYKQNYARSPSIH